MTKMTKPVMVLIFVLGMLGGVRFGIISDAFAPHDVLTAAVGLGIAIPTGWAGMSQINRRK